MELSARNSAEATSYERLARKGLAAYGLADAGLSLISRKGRIVFSVIDDAPEGREVYAFRICGRDESRERLMREFLFLEELRRSLDLNVPEPVLTRTGELFQSVSTPGVSGFRLVCLLRWVAGRPLPPADWTEKDARAAGRLIGEIHKASEGFRWPSELKPAGDDVDRIPSVHRGLPPIEQESIEEATDLARRSIESLAADPKARGIIHADLVSEHVLFSPAGVGAIGFSSCRPGYYLYDLATIAIELDEPLRERLISGYRDIRPIEVEPLDGFIALRALDLHHNAGPDQGKRPIALIRGLLSRR